MPGRLLGQTGRRWEASLDVCQIRGITGAWANSPEPSADLVRNRHGCFLLEGIRHAEQTPRY